MCQDSTSLPHLPGLVLGWLGLALDTEQRASSFPSSDPGVFFKMDFIPKGKTITNIFPSERKLRLLSSLFFSEIETEMMGEFLEEYEKRNPLGKPGRSALGCPSSNIPYLKGAGGHL